MDNITTEYINNSRYDEAAMGMIVFACKLNKCCLLNPENISLYYPICKFKGDIKIQGKTMKLPSNNGVTPGNIASFFFKCNRYDKFVICRGVLTGNESCFKPGKMVESRVFSYGGRSISIKISAQSVHVTASKNIDEDYNTICNILDNIIYYDYIISILSEELETIEWFFKHTKTEPQDYITSAGVVYTRNIINDVITEWPNNLNEDIIHYLMCILYEYDDHETFVNHIIYILTNKPRLYIGEEPIFESFNPIFISKWISIGWIPCRKIVGELFRDVSGYITTGFDITLSPDLKIIYKHDEYDDSKVTLTVKVKKFSASGKHEKYMRIAVNRFLEILEKNKKFIEINID